jgi:hypothetical protein
MEAARKDDKESMIRAIQSMGDSLRTELGFDVANLLHEQEDKVREMFDVVMEKVDEIHDAIQFLQRDIGRLNESHNTLMSTMERDECFMPLTFTIIPESEYKAIQIQQAPPADEGMSSSFFGRAWKSVSKSVDGLKDKALSLAWTNSRLFFICPLSNKMMRCGPEGKGYVISMPTEALQVAAPALKWGMRIVKVALATQGLGAVVPDIGDMMDSLVEGACKGIEDLDLGQFGTKLLESAVDKMRDEIEDLAADGTKEITGAIDLASQPALVQIYKLILKSEGCKNVDNALARKQKPQHTGLVLATHRGEYYLKIVIVVVMNDVVSYRIMLVILSYDILPCLTVSSFHVVCYSSIKVLMANRSIFGYVRKRRTSS